jgi:hypothetical protein
MKAKILFTRFAQLALFILLIPQAYSQTQGRVVINEYMPWTSSGCGTTAEFVELLNFGPGAVNIGCYIVTTGVYSITIPPNTILKPGEFYVLAGQNFIPGNCANTDSTASGVTANLNWSTCNCTNIPIPQTGDGMMSDGGTSNTPLVLLDPSMNIIDAVVRSLPTETVGTITSSGVSGNCTPMTFNIGTMNPGYEVLGMSTGRGNSFARTLDGDCNWMKDTHQSANASNNRSGRTTDISYDFDLVSATSCSDIPSGHVSIYVKHSNYSTVFPMTYTIALDTDNNGIFTASDLYSTVTDTDPPFVEIENLPIGRFRVTLASTKGCYLQNFDFTIIPCNPGTLPVRLLYFKQKSGKNNQHDLEWLLQDAQNMQSIVVEKAGENGKFVTAKIITNQQFSGEKTFSYTATGLAETRFYRLKISQKSGQTFYSSVLQVANSKRTEIRIGPNPTTDKLELLVNSLQNTKADYTIYNASGISVKTGKLRLAEGENKAFIPVHALLPGTYHLQVNGLQPEGQPISFRFVKH